MTESLAIYFHNKHFIVRPYNVSRPVGDLSGLEGTRA